MVYLVMSDNESSTSFLGRMAFRLLVNRTLKKADEFAYWCAGAAGDAGLR